jgi:acetolactate synthase I/II/III large subunit
LWAPVLRATKDPEVEVTALVTSSQTFERRTDGEVEPSGRVRLADYVMSFLVDRGVDRIFLLTGNGAMYLNDAIAQQQRVKYYCARNEAAAPMMAESYARLSGKLGVVCVTSGPGATNAVAGLAEAWVDSAPIMIISGQGPFDQFPPAEAARGVRSFATAAIDIIPVVKTLTKYAVTITQPHTIRFHLERAYELATTGRPGPVWIDLPMDIQYSLINPALLASYHPDIPVAPPEPQISETVSLLQRAKRPLIVAGQGVRQGNAIDLFKRLLDRAGIPVVFSRLGQDILPFSHSLNMGQVGRRGVKYSKQLLAKPDLVIALGSRLSVSMAGAGLEHLAQDAAVVMVDIDPAEIAHQSPRVNVPVCGDVRMFLERLLRHLSSIQLPDWKTWSEECRALKSANPMVLPEQKRDPLDIYYFMARLDALADERHVFVTDAGSNYYVGGQVYRFEKGQREITSGAFAAMGLSIPLAIGAAVARPEAQILAVTGDGSLELNIQELKTLSYYGFNVKLFVLNNGGYVSMRNWQDSFFDGRRIGSDDTTGAEMLDLRKVADTFDLHYELIERVDDVDHKLRAIMARSGPAFVEVVCDSKQVIVQPYLETALSS